MINTHYKLYLCSNSPRRRELIKALGFDVEILPLNADECYPVDLQADETAEYIARKKADAIDFSQLSDNALCITSDTVVICDEIILGKPKNNEEAIAMLKLLSGKTHKVVSGVCLTCANLFSKKR
ncbi:MAG: Maf family protein, partial [Bacteroidales bacterium]|nr:Maf family protein [Bacteroidales bacterium]